MSEVIRSKRFGCGLGYSVEFEVAPTAGSGPILRAIWEPDVPRGRAMRRTVDRYRTARDSFLADLRHKTGAASISVVEVPQ